MQQSQRPGGQAEPNSAPETQDGVDHPHLHLIGAATPIREVISLDSLPDSVLRALRSIREVRERQLNELSLTDRRLLAAAEHLIARYTDLQAQIDANGKRAPEAS